MENPKIECNGPDLGGLSRTMEREGEGGGFLFFLTLLLLLLSNYSSKAQTYKELFHKDTSIRFIETDLLENLYVVTSRNVILKYDSTGKLFASQKFNASGEIDRLDVSNALNPQVFYSGQSSILILDNTLSILSTIVVDENAIRQFGTGCRSTESGFWLYDIGETRLKKVNASAIVQRTSQPFGTLGFSDMTPSYMAESMPWLYVCLPGSGICIFDSYGAYFKTLAFPEIRRFQLQRNKLYYCSRGKLNYILPETNEQKAVILPFLDKDAEAIRDIKISGRRLYVQYKNGVRVFGY